MRYLFSTGFILNVYANDIKLNEDSENRGSVRFPIGTEVNLACRYQKFEVRLNNGVEPVFTDDHHHNLSAARDDQFLDTGTLFLNYTISSQTAEGVYGYICEYTGIWTVEVTVIIGGGGEC